MNDLRFDSGLTDEFVLDVIVTVSNSCTRIGAWLTVVVIESRGRMVNVIPVDITMTTTVLNVKTARYCTGSP